MGRQFTVQRGATRVVFGAGASADVAAEIDRLGARRALFVCTPRREESAKALAARVGPERAAVVAIAREHVPADVVSEARAAVEAAKADLVVALGGGSAIGLAKALALGAAVRVAAIPTTYSGSEVTAVYGITEAGKKTTGKDERVRPALVVYDPDLTAGLPRDATIASLWNAMAHAAEALWVPAIERADRLAALGAEEALRILAESAARLASRIDDAAARESALEGAYLAGAAFSDVGGGLHHRLCHVLGGAFGAPHAETHAVLLPHVARFYREAPRAAAIARALFALDPSRGLFALARATSAPSSLAAIGVPKDGVARVVDEVLASPPPSPRPLDRDALVDLLERAWSGPKARGAPPPLRAPPSIATHAGLFGPHQSEALAGALPAAQNAPRRAPYGLYPELLSGTPFTVKSAESSRVWMYRVRPSFAHGAFASLPRGLFGAELGDASPTRARWRPLPIPEAPAEVDFLDGLVTLGGAGDPSSGGPGYAVHLYAANAGMRDRAFADADGDLLLVPQHGALDCRTELGWLRVPPGSIAIIPRGLKVAVGAPDGAARGWVLEVLGRRLRLPERGPIGSNGLADARHFLAPAAAFEDRLCPDGFQIVHKLGGRLYAATQEHSPFDVVAWHGNHAPFSYDLALFNAMGSVSWDHPDPSILTVLTAPLDDHGRSIADFVVFPGRWEVTEHSFRPPFMHRNSASEINVVIETPAAGHGYDAGCTFLSPLLTAHGVATHTYDQIFARPGDAPDPPHRIPDASLWAMFESALPFRATAWAAASPLVDRDFLRHFEGARSYFDPSRR